MPRLPRLLPLTACLLAASTAAAATAPAPPPAPPAPPAGAAPTLDPATLQAAARLADAYQASQTPPPPASAAGLQAMATCELEVLTAQRALHDHEDAQAGTAYLAACTAFQGIPAADRPALARRRGAAAQALVDLARQLARSPALEVGPSTTAAAVPPATPAPAAPPAPTGR